MPQLQVSHQFCFAQIYNIKVEETKKETQDMSNMININVYMYMAKNARLKHYPRQS